MVSDARVLVVLDGAAEPVRPWPTTLQEAATPALDALCARGAVGAAHPTPPGLPPGSETGLPTLLGAVLAAPVSRGRVEAAAAHVDVGSAGGVWRVDVFRADGSRTDAREARLVQPLLRDALPGHCVSWLRGHRFLALGETRPTLERVSSLPVHVWEDGATLPRTLDGRTAMVCGGGAAAGCASLMGAQVVIPAGATGDVDTDLGAKTRVALALLADARIARVVVHVGGPDEAAHRRDRVAKREILEAADAAVVAPLARAARELGTSIAVTADHGTCPYTGAHDAAPTPLVVAGPGVAPAGPRTFDERAIDRTPTRPAA